MVTTVYVDGMRSVHCVRAIFTALTAVAGIAHADVTMGKVVVEHDGTLAAGDLENAIASIGYVVRDVVHERRRLRIRDVGAPDEPAP